MDDKHASDPLADSPAYTVVNGYDVVTDPGLALLGRFMPVLVVVAAPYAGLGGDQDPLNPVEHAGEWALLRAAFQTVHEQQTDASAPLAVARLLPPTTERLGQALAVICPDVFQVVHFVCHGERDMLFLEDENGHQAYAVAEQVVNLFKPAQVRLVLLDGCFSRRLAQLLIDQTGVCAVIGTRRKVSEANTVAFNARFYGGITRGIGVGTAFRAALGQLTDQADRYELVTRNETQDEVLDLPRDRALRPLLYDGQPRLAGVPQVVGFVGRRELLTALADDVPAPECRLYAVDGPLGVGKTWLVAEYVTRFAWQFPGGVIWRALNAQTTARELIAQLARFNGLSLDAPVETVCAGLRKVLIVWDQVDWLSDPGEIEQIAAFIQALDVHSGSRVIVIGRQLPDRLAQILGTRRCHLEPLEARAARTLAMRLAVERDLDTLDVDTIDDFLERTHGLPWLIVNGVERVQSDGLTYALDDLAAFRPDAPDALERYLARHLTLLNAEDSGSLRLLARLQGLPDAFDGGLAAAMLKQNTGDEIARLLKYSLLRRVDALYVVPPTVRALLQQYFPLGPHERDAADAAALEYLIRSWPQEDSPQRRAWLGNLRAILFRLQNRNVPVKILAQVLVVTAVAFRETGLSDEFLTYAGTVREQLPEGDLLARLQIAMGETLSAMPGRETEAGWLLEVTQRVEGAVRAQAGLAYGRYLVQVGQLEAAEQVLLRALQMLVKDRDADIVLAASLTHEWANVLIAAGRSEEAIPRYEAALAGYAQSQRADLSVEARRDFADVLVSLGDVDRAEDLLRRTLITADQIGQRAVSAQLRQRLATITATRAASDPGEWQSAESLLGDTVHDLLPQAGAWVALAGVYHELSRVQARLGRVDCAIDHASRSRAWFEDAGCLAESAAAALTLGQLSMAQGNAVAAQATLHEALDLAEVAGDSTLAAQVAGVLVRVHQIRARYARQADPSFRQDTVKQANFTLARLAGLGLDDHVAALDAVVREIGPGVDVNE